MVNEGQVGDEFGETKGYGMEVNEQQSGVNVSSVGQNEGVTMLQVLPSFEIMDETE